MGTGTIFNSKKGGSMKDFVIEMLKRVKPWGIVLLIIEICYLLFIHIVKIDGVITEYSRAIIFFIVLVLVGYFIWIFVFGLSYLYGMLNGKVVRKIKRLDRSDFNENKEYYRKILKNNSPLILGYLDNLNVEKIDLIAELLFLKKKRFNSY